MPLAERVVDILAGRTAVGARATIQGWIRTRRDSKAGLSFLHVHDGSCFDALQVVAPATLANYGDEILHLTVGCAVTVTGTIVWSAGSTTRTPIRSSPSRTRSSTCARSRICARARTRDRRGDARAALPRHGDPSLLR
jgi:aspartyl/asparaginyl-tRNA synthetase